MKTGVTRLPLLLLAAWPAGVAGEGVPPSEGIFPPEVIRVEALPLERVQLTVSVLDREGEPVTGLSLGDFHLREGGLDQTLIEFGREADRQDRPMSVVFLVDRSGSIGGQMRKWREAGASLISALRPIDEVMVATFNTEREVLVDFTRDSKAVSSAVDTFHRPVGGTLIFKAVNETLHELRRRHGRKVIFLLTDGLDNQFAAAWNTLHSAYLSRLVRTAVHSQVTVVTILPGPTGRPFLAAQDLAVQTGGWWQYPSDDLPALVRKLGRRLLESYYLSYDSTWPLSDTRRREIEVTVSRPDLGKLHVRTIGGVYGGTPLLDLLIEDLEDTDELERARAASELGFLAAKASVRPLKRALSDPSAIVRMRAAEALGRLGEVTAARPLARLLEDPDPEAREAALIALQLLLEKETDETAQARILDAIQSAE